VGRETKKALKISLKKKILEHEGGYSKRDESRELIESMKENPIYSTCPKLNQTE